MSKKAIIIAEAGVNHNGDLKLAYKLIDVAAEAGADYVKFQTYKTENLVTPQAEQASYQKENTGTQETQFQMLKRLELKYEDHYALKEYAEKKRIKFLSTAFDDESIDFLYQLGIDFYKVPSGEITNYFYLRNIAQKGLPVVLSTGMSTMDEVHCAMNLLNEFGVSNENITVLHCNSQYPTPLSDVNLRAMITMRDELGVKVGYSDHTLGIEAAVAATALGASIIEKHFTLDKNMPGPDHKASLEPEELKQMIRLIRNVEMTLGDGKKIPTQSEMANIIPARKSLVFREDYSAGTILDENHFISLRPCDGITPMEVKKFLGKKLKTSVKKGDKFKTDHLE